MTPPVSPYSVLLAMSMAAPARLPIVSSSFV
jgi:hypothetical protein